MTRIPRIALVILFGCAPALAQTTAYSFDNFDTRNGVRVQVEPAKTPAKAGRSRRLRIPSADKVADQNNLGSITLDSQRSLVSPTVLSYDALATQSNSSSLRGYTTGSAEVDGYLINSGARHGVDPLLLYSVMHQESSFKSRAISPKGARGLMQLMPLTAARFGVTNIFDPKQNIEGGARYLRFLLDHFDGDVNLALAGYNAGEGAVEKYGWRIPPYAETQKYVRRGLLVFARVASASVFSPELVANVRAMEVPRIAATAGEVVSVNNELAEIGGTPAMLYSLRNVAPASAVAAVTPRQLDPATEQGFDTVFFDVHSGTRYLVKSGRIVKPLETAVDGATVESGRSEVTKSVYFGMREK